MIAIRVSETATMTIPTSAALVNEAMTETGSVPASLAMKGLCELPGLKALPQVPAMTALAATAG